MATLILTSDYECFHWKVTGLPKPFNTSNYTYVGIATSPVQPNQPFPPQNRLSVMPATSNYNYTYTPEYTRDVSAGVYQLYAFYVDTSNRCYPINANPESVTVYSEPTYWVTLSCGEGVSSFVTDIPDVGTVTSSITKTNVRQKTYHIIKVTTTDGYTEPYIMGYDIVSYPYSGSKTFLIGSNNEFTVSDHNRTIQISATKDIDYYYYKCSVVVNGKTTSYDVESTTSSSVSIAELKSQYASSYIVTRIAADGYDIASSVRTYSLSASKNKPYMYVDFVLYCTSVVAPNIDYVSATATTITVEWDKNGGTTGLWYILYGTSTTGWSVSNKVRVTTPGEYTITGLDYKTGYFISCVNVADVSGQDIAYSEDIYVDRGGGGGGGSGGRTIQPFAWTSNDDQYIKAGQPITNLKASAWNSLLDKMAEVCNVNGQIITDINGQWAGRLRVSSGETIGKIKFNALVNDLAQMYGTGNVVDPVGDGYQVIKATYFANDLKYFEDIKSAINRAINAINT